MSSIATQFDYTVTTDKSFDDAVAAVETLAAESGFRVLATHDVAATLASKGFEREPYKIVEICQAGPAYRALNADPMVGLFMPCKINVFTRDGKVVLSAMRPIVLADFFPGKGLEDLALEVDTAVRAVVDKAK